MAIRLDSPMGMSHDINAVLSVHSAAFRDNRHVERLLDIGPLRDVCAELNRICSESGVVGFHFTRANRLSILKHGLLKANGEERRAEFLKTYGDLFSESQRERLEAAWSLYFQGSQNESRNGYVWFNLTKEALKDGGAESLLRYFGGESIYMPVTADPEIAAVLQGIGEQLVVECVLDVGQSNAFHEYPWGIVWLSSYHCSLNHDAIQFDQDVRVTYSIPPADIVSISHAAEPH